MRVTGVGLFFTALCVAAVASAELHEVRGGFVVCIGRDAMESVSGEWDRPGFVFQCLATSRDDVASLRKKIQAAGCYGRASVDTFAGKSLPYIDGMVNLVIARRFDMGEVDRVLAPGGVSVIGGKKTRKPFPPSIDDWTHYTYDASGVMVSRDERVAPPRRMQWDGDPKWLRNHEFMSSMHAMVSSGGRIFYIMDEGRRSHIFLPPKWRLIARDGFNGTVLWKREMADWHVHVWTMKSGPGYLPRRIVAMDERVYATLGYNAPVTALDAASGKTVHTYEGTIGTEEILLADGVLYLLVDPAKKPTGFRESTTSWAQAKTTTNLKFGWSRKQPERLVVAVEADTGEIRWRHQTHIAPLTLACAGGRVYYYNGDDVVALDAGTGSQTWRTPTPITYTPATGYTHRMVYADETVIFCHSGIIHAFEAKNGRELWKEKLLKTGHNSPNDLYVMGGRVWSVGTGVQQTHGTPIKAFNLKTGDIVEDFAAENIEGYFMHQRCYPGRATKDWLITSGTGTEFYNVGGERKVDIHHHVRGSCIYGIMPANGLLYKPADTCACHFQSKITHMTALAAGESRVDRPVPEPERLFKGAAYGEVEAEAGPRVEDWPVYRGDSSRSGYTSTSLGTQLTEQWQAEIGGKLSAMVVGGGMAYVAAVDRHTLYALDAKKGSVAWTFTAGGRIDSPPTLYKGLALFGCADGFVYALRASDGELAWRYHAAPGRGKMMSRQQIESRWPVHGSVLVARNRLYALAGRNMLLDGGMRMLLLDPVTGEKKSETVLNEIDPETGKHIQHKMPGKAMPVANPDILSCDDKFIYMGAQKFEYDGKRIDVNAPKFKEMEQYGEGRHLFCPTGFLDDSWFHRSFMIYGRTGGEGHNEYARVTGITPIGRLIALDEDNAYGFRAANYANTMRPRTHHLIYSAPRDRTEQEKAAVAAQKRAAVSKPEPAAESSHKKGKRPKKGKKEPSYRPPKLKYHWQVENPGVLANAMVLADDTLFVAGPPDITDEGAAFQANFEDSDSGIMRSLKKQDEAWDGAQGGVLVAVDKQTGEKKAEYKLDHIPVFDGMAAAHGALFIPLSDGNVVCFGKEE